LSKYGDTKSARAIMLVELKKLIDKLQFPNLKLKVKDTHQSKVIFSYGSILQRQCVVTFDCCFVWMHRFY